MKSRGVVEMPDGDFTHNKVGRDYKKPYEALCEGHFTEERVAQMIAKALVKTLKKYGNNPVQLANRVFSEICDALNQNFDIELSVESKVINQVAFELMGHRRAMPLAIDACKEYVMQVIEGKNQGTIVPLIRNYVERALAADFLERFPLDGHHNNASPEFVRERLEKVRPHLGQEIEHIVSQIAK